MTGAQLIAIRRFLQENITNNKEALFQNEWVEQNLFTFEKFNFPVKK